MVDKCKVCKAKIIKFPLWKGQEYDEPFAWNKVIWLNWFKMDWTTVMWIAVIGFLIWSYFQDIERFEDIKDDPCGFCQGASQACNYNNEGFFILQKKDTPGLSSIIANINIS